MANESRLQVRLPAALHKSFMEWCRANDTTPTEFVRGEIARVVTDKKSAAAKKPTQTTLDFM